MHFEKSGIYHIYNQGNNRQSIFFNRENYLFFLRKTRTHVLPFSDVLAWCLMPNHFHLMIYVLETELPLCVADEEISPNANLSRARTNRTISLNHSIGIMLASYTRAINKQERKTGSLFRQETKSICLNEIKNSIPDWFLSSGITYFKVDIPEWQYPKVCFNYIHNNPVAAGLVNMREEWDFSSWCDITGKRNGSLINKKRISELKLL